MKIVHICRKLLEGFAYQDNELPDMHSSMGHDVTVITSKSDNSSLYFDMSLIDSSGRKAPEVLPKYNIIRLPLKHQINFRLWDFKYLYETLCSLSPDLIFFHGTPFLSILNIVKYKKENRNVKLFVDCHADYYNSAGNLISYYCLHKGLYRIIVSITKKHVDRYYYIKPSNKVFMRKMYNVPVNKLKFLPLGANLDKIPFGNSVNIRKEIRISLGINEDDIIIISGGKLDFKKNIHNLIIALNKITDPKVHLIIFGLAADKYQSLLVSLIGENPRIHMVGWLDSNKIYDYYLASDIACFPGLHSVLWEQAICCSLPLISKKMDGFDYLNVHENAIFIDNGDASEIEKVLRSIIYDDDLRSRMKENSDKFGKEFFSYRRIAESIIEDTL